MPGSATEAAEETKSPTDTATGQPQAEGDVQAPGDDDGPTAADTDGQASEQLWPDIAEVLELLVRNGILDPASPAARRRLIEAILQAGGYGLEFSASAAETDQPDTDPAHPDTVYRAAVLVYDAFHYLRIPKLDETAAKHLTESLQELADNGLRGLILDLRCSNGRVTRAAVNLGAQLAETDAPVVVLIGGTTSGAPELLAQLLAQRHNTVSIGTPTKGQPFPFVQYPLDHGGAVLLPDADAPGSDLVWPPVPVQPDIEVAMSLDCETLAGMNLSADNVVTWLAKDAQLRRAADLLVMIRGLHDQHH